MCQLSESVSSSDSTFPRLEDRVNTHTMPKTLIKGTLKWSLAKVNKIMFIGIHTCIVELTSDLKPA